MEPSGEESLASRGDGVTRLEYAGKELYVVGTAHVSRKSVEEVRAVIAELRPDAVCVELDAARFDTLMDESRFRLLDVRTVLRERRAGILFASLLFSSFQKRLGDRLGVRPGAEMLAAVDAAREVGAEIVLADRDIQATLRRCYASLGPVDRTKVTIGLAFLPFAAADIGEADVERLKGREAIGDAMTAFAAQMPALKVPLIDERDQYLIASTREAPGKRVVSVVGAAHVAGMVKNLEAPIDRARLTERRGEPLSVRVLPLVLPLLVLLVLALGAARGLPVSALVRLGASLSIGAATGAFAGVVLAGGHLVAALAVAALAPLSVVLPFLPFGELAGSVQARLRLPSGEDAFALRADVLVPTRLRQNPFLVVLLVTVTSRFGRTAGTLVVVVWALFHLRR